MNSPALAAVDQSLSARISASAELPWIPSSQPGTTVKLLRFLKDDSGFVELLRLEPGTVMPLHRHTGAVHVYNLSGSRQLCTGEIVGPGEYVYEPPGCTDWWKVVGDEPVVALVVVFGTVEFLDPSGVVRGRADVETQRADYEAYCRTHNLPILDLTD